MYKFLLCKSKFFRDKWIGRSIGHVLPGTLAVLGCVQTDVLGPPVHNGTSMSCRVQHIQSTTRHGMEFLFFFLKKLAVEVLGGFFCNILQKAPTSYETKGWGFLQNKLQI